MTRRTINWFKFFKLRRKVKNGFRGYTGDCFTLRQAKILQKCLTAGIPEDEEYNLHNIYARTYCSDSDRESLFNIPASIDSIGITLTSIDKQISRLIAYAEALEAERRKTNH